MTSIHSLPATGATLRDLADQVGGVRDARIRPRTFLGCVSQAYMVHMMNVRRLSGRLLSCVTFSSVYVAILAARSCSAIAFVKRF